MLTLRVSLAALAAVALSVGGTLTVVRTTLSEPVRPPELTVAPPAFEVPEDSGTSVDVPFALRADRLVLPQGSFQADIAPSGVDLSETMYVYAMSPLPAPLLADYLTGHLSEGGWTVVSMQSLLEGPTLEVISPSGAKGVLQVNATPPGVPGYASAVSGALER